MQLATRFDEAPLAYLLSAFAALVYIVALALFMLDTCRYGFTDWGVTHLKEIGTDSVSGASIKYAVLPFGGYVVDRWIDNNNADVLRAEGAGRAS